MPTWYRVLKAAQYLGVSPWELAAQPLAYVVQAETARVIEDQDQKRREAHQARVGKARGG